MDSHEKKINVVDTHLSEEPAIGQWLWALQDTRLRTMEELDSVSQVIQRKCAPASWA
jgi:hypothetical protein